MTNFIKWLQCHNIDVVDFSDGEILVNTIYSVNGVACEVREIIPANLTSIEAYLGY